MTIAEHASNSVEHPNYIAGPWTRDARLRAIQEEVRIAYIDYFRKAVKTRNWFPWDDLPPSAAIRLSDWDGIQTPTR